MKKKSILAAALAVLFTAANVAYADIKIAQLDGMSGPFSNVGEQQRRTLQDMVAEVNAAGGLNGEKLELITIDGKGSPQETLNAFKQATDQGVRFITQGNSSAVAAALVDAVSKHNRRNPDARVVYFNHSGIDNDLTNSKCDFWHFRFDPNVEMKVSAIADKLISDDAVKSVYLINQNYALGQQFSESAKRILGASDSKLSVVGDDLHPFGQVKDFSSYAAKIKESGADAVMTGNWGNDLSLLVKAINEAGLKVGIYTVYGSGFGAPTAIKENGVDTLKVISLWLPNIKDDKSAAFANAYNEKYGQQLYFHQIRTMMQMFAKAANDAGSNDPLKVAQKLEGMAFESDTGPVLMRKDDHQIQVPLFLGTLKKTASNGGPADVVYDAENAKLVGFQIDSKVNAEDTAKPTVCKMNRPS